MGTKLKEFQGTQAEKKACFDAMFSDMYQKIEEYESEALYYRNVARAIDRKVDLAQSILANMSVSMRVGIRVDN